MPKIPFFSILPVYERVCALFARLPIAGMIPPAKPTFPLPPLPTIRSETIVAQVFTHRSLYARPTHIFEDRHGDLSPDNERYEHLGDTVLGLVVTELTLRLYPGLRVGPATKMKAIVVGNSTLAEISHLYNLPDRLRMHPAQGITLRASTHIQADVFEAFIGGLYTEQGLEAVRAWLTSLLTPYIQNAYNRVRTEHGLMPVEPPAVNATNAVRMISPPPSPGSTATVAESMDEDVTSSSNVDASMASVIIAAPNNGAAYGYPYRPDASYSTSGHLALFNQYVQKECHDVEWHYFDIEGKEIVHGMDSNTEAITPFGGDAAAVGKDLGMDINELLDALPTMCGTKTTPIWTVSVLVDGKYSGAGRGQTKKAARNEAAKVGLMRLGLLD